VSRDMSKDLTIVVTGLGKITLPNLNDLLENWMFGDQDEREIRIIVPVLSKMGVGLKEFCKWGINIGFDFTIVQAGDVGMTKEITSLPEKCFVRVDNDRDALTTCMDLLLEDVHKGNETAFIMLYDETSTYKQGDPHLSDREIIGEAKNHVWLTTLNLCQGLTDFFEGYESAHDIAHREYKEATFAEEQAKLKAAEPKLAKKAAAPRKRAAKKAVAPKSTPVLEEPEKPLQEPSEPITRGWGDDQGNCIHYFVWADDGMGNDGSVCTNCGLEEPSVGDSVEVAGIKFTKKHDPLCALGSTHPGDCRIDISITQAEVAKRKNRTHVGTENWNFTDTENIAEQMEREFVRPKLPIEKLVEDRVALADDGMIDVDHLNPHGPLDLSATVPLTSSNGPVTVEIPNQENSAYDFKIISSEDAVKNVQESQEIWDDIAKARSPWDTDSSKDAMLRHAKAVQAMGQAFTDVIGTLVELMEEKSV
jgi:hypothetical protein